MRQSKKCMVCGIDSKAIGTHIKYKHNIPYKEYYDLYLKKENEGLCLVCKIETKFTSVDGYSVYCKDHFNRQEQLKQMRSTVVFKDAVSKSAKERAKDPNTKFGKPPEWTEERKEVHSALIKQLVEDPNHKLGKRYEYTEKGRDTISQKCSEMLKDPNNKFGKPSRCWAIEYSGVLFKSSWEAQFAMDCDSYNIVWQYEPLTFKLLSGSRYTPDFYLPQYDVWVEVKPQYRLNETIIPAQHFREVGMKYLIITEENRHNILSLLV